jgi:hypothetical protein
MTEIPHLIREKVKDYLNAIYLLEWRIKMDMICLEYKKKTDCNYEDFPISISYFSLSIAGFFYNYRHLAKRVDGWSNYVYSSRKGFFKAVCKLSPNY